MAAQVALVLADFEAARRSMERTRLLDPLNRTIARVEAMNNVIAGSWGAAQAYFDDCAANGGCVNASILDTHELIAMTHMGRAGRALRVLERIVARDDSDRPPAVIQKWQQAVREVNSGDTVSLPDDVSAYLDLSFGLDEYLVTALVRNERYDEALDYLDRAANSDKFWGTFRGHVLLSRGVFELPDGFRKHPGYRTFWDRDGWRDIARARIANGHPEGMPLNEDGSVVEF